MEIKNAEKLYWRFFNFFVRRVVASAFVVVGLIMSISFIFNGTFSDDIPMKAIAVGMPLIVAACGFFVFRTKPYYPSKFSEDERTNT